MLPCRPKVVRGGGCRRPFGGPVRSGFDRRLTLFERLAPKPTPRGPQDDLTVHEALRYACARRLACEGYLPVTALTLVRTGAGRPAGWAGGAGPARLPCPLGEEPPATPLHPPCRQPHCINNPTNSYINPPPCFSNPPPQRSANPLTPAAAARRRGPMWSTAQAPPRWRRVRGAWGSGRACWSGGRGARGGSWGWDGWGMRASGRPCIKPFTARALDRPHLTARRVPPVEKGSI